MAKPNVREQILEASARLLLERGFNATSVQDITAAAGVPKGSFYNHFESKEVLGAEIVDRYGEVRGTRLAIVDRSLSPLERLRGHFEGLVALYVGMQCARGCLVGNFSAELAGQSELIRERLRHVYARWTTELEEAIAEAQAEGTIRAQPEAPQLAAFLLDSFEGAVLRSRVVKSRAPYDVFMTVIFGSLLAV
jgi:TetR/AcrR family transcriptional repressor of nem operon